MVLSLYGLYGFATDNMELEWYFAVPIMAIFDLAEVVCFVSLYRSATFERSWTRPMRSTRRMAWALVAASSAMNAAHAPGNWVATLAFAAVPPISARLIEFELDKQMAANDSDSEPEDSGPGLVRLVQLAYTHAWAAIFARLGFDATTKDGLIHQDARIRRAARQIRDLRRALEAQDASTTRRSEKKARKRVEDVQERAEYAIDVAGIAGETPAQLTLARHLVTRGRLIDLARMDVRDPMGIVSMLEDFAIVPSAEAIHAGAKAAQADEQRRAAEEARDRALAAKAEAESEAEAVQKKAADALKSAQEVGEKAEKHAEAMISEATAAAEAARRAKSAQGEAETERTKLAEDVKRLSAHAEALRDSATTTDSQRQQLADQLTQLRGEVERAADLVVQRKREAETAKTQAQEALRTRRAAVDQVEEANTTVTQLQAQAEELRRAVGRRADDVQRHTVTIDRLTEEIRTAEAATRRAVDQAEHARRQAQDDEEARRVASVALRHARTELLDALTSPHSYEPPRWTSPAKMRGWDLYLHTVRTTGAEPTDAELAGDDRDASTARKWLTDFRAEIARLTADALPAQQDARDRTADEAPALV